MSETSKTAKIILVLYWGLGYNRTHIRCMVQYSTKMIFAVLDVSFFMGLNIGETDNFFYVDGQNVLVAIGLHHQTNLCLMTSLTMTLLTMT